MSRLDNILADYYGEGDTAIQPEAKQQIKDLVLELIEGLEFEHMAVDDADIDDGKILWTDELKKKVEKL